MTGRSRAPTVPGSRSRSTTSAIIVLVVGAVFTVCGPVLGILLGSVAVVPAALDHADGTARLAPSAVVDLDVDDSVFLLAPVSDLDSADHTACTASGPEGAVAEVAAAPADALNTHVHGARYESFARVTADEPGSYTLACDTSIDVVSAPPFELGAFLGPFGGWAVGGLLVSLVGVVLAILGIVRLARASRPV